MEKLKRGLLYLSLHNQLIKKFGLNHPASKEEICIKLGRHYQIPKNLRVLELKNIEDMGLIKTISPKDVIILPCDINIETESNKLFQLAGIF